MKNKIKCKFGNGHLKPDLATFRYKLWARSKPFPRLSLFNVLSKSFSENITGDRQDLGSFVTDDD